MASCNRYNIMWKSLSVACGRSVVFSRYSELLHQYNWNVVESVIKHHKPNPNSYPHTIEYKNDHDIGNPRPRLEPTQA